MEDEVILDEPVEATESNPNTTCADCEAEEPCSLSISHGSNICEDCSEQHKKLGPHVSLVKNPSDEELTKP
jgi:ADP-ribosylation factor GTPase-activating protein 2/3